MAYIDFLSPVHKATKRDYIGRVNEFPKAQAAKIGKEYGFDYWDGERQYGYGGYKYIEGYWSRVAEPMIKHYGLKPGDKVLDVGCGKAFLINDMAKAVPGLKVYGLDISQYAIDHALPLVQPNLRQGNCIELPYADHSFDLVISINTIHNLFVYDVEKAVKEIERVGKDKKYICVEAYESLEQKVNLLYWVITGECYFTPKEWEWVYEKCGYTGDYSFIYFD